MKRNKLTKATSVLLALTLISTSLISGTFAKYVTSVQANDTTARVAKWGVEISESGGLFSKTYVQKDDGNIPGTGGSSETLTVSSDNKDDKNLVAPGTKSSDEGLTFSVTGTPEVAVKIAVDITVDNDIFLANGTYVDYTSYNSSDATSNKTFELKYVKSGSKNDKDGYYPVKFKLVKGTDTKLENATLADVKEYFEDNNNWDSTKVIDANTDLSDATNGFGTYTLTWAWDYSDADQTTPITNNDKADTLLGNLAADSSIKALATTSEGVTTYTTLTSGTNYSTDIGLTFKITVTQVD
jgi:hypothetical protein